MPTDPTPYSTRPPHAIPWNRLGYESKAEYNKKMVGLAEALIDELESEHFLNKIRDKKVSGTILVHTKAGSQAVAEALRDAVGKANMINLWIALDATGYKGKK